MGITPLPEEDDALKKAKDRASNHIMSAAQDAVMSTVEEDDREHICEKG